MEASDSLTIYTARAFAATSAARSQFFPGQFYPSPVSHPLRETGLLSSTIQPDVNLSQQPGLWTAYTSRQFAARPNFSQAQAIHRQSLTPCERPGCCEG